MKKANSQLKVLFLTLYSGENEYDELQQSLKIQSYRNWEHIVFRNLPNKTAHMKLYSHIMNNSSKYDLFIKLDADMTLKDEHTLKQIVQFFIDNPNVGQANFSVWDVISQQPIMGLIAFRKNTRWEETEEMLFVDNTPKIDGIRLLVWGNPSPVANHSQNPSIFQAFHFGAHRAMKAIQRNRNKIDTIQSAIQWNFLWRAWRNYKIERDMKRAYFLLGAYYMWKGKLGDTANNYSDPNLKSSFKECSSYSEEYIFSVIRRDFSKTLFRKNLLYIFLYPKLYEYRLRYRVKVLYNRILIQIQNIRS